MRALLSAMLALSAVHCIAQERGAVVVQAAPRSAAERAGLKAGDLVTGWSSGSEHGDIDSPFDLTEIELEYSSRGVMELRGRDSSQDRTWRIGPDAWKITIRPILRPPLLALYQEGWDLVVARKFAEGASHWREAAVRADPADPPWLAAWLLAEAGTLLVRARQWDTADEVTRLALDRAAGARSMTRVQILESWAQTFYQRDWAQAELRFRESLAERRKLRAQSLSIAYITNSLGYVARNQGNLAKAKQFYREALDLGRSLAPESLAVSLFLNNMGAVCQHRGELIQAEDYYLESLALSRKLAPNATLAVINNLATIASKEGNFPKAEEYWQTDLRLREMQAPDNSQIFMLYHNLGQLAQTRGDLAAAGAHFQRALDLIGKIDPDGLDFADTLERLGGVAWRRGDFNQAEEYHQRTLTMKEKLEPGTLSYAQTLRNLGTVAASRGDLGKATDYHTRALKIRETLAPGSEDHADSLLRIAGLLQTKGELAESTKLTGDALDTLESQAAKLDGTERARQNFRAQYASHYRDYLDLLLTQKQSELAFEALERSRARSLLSMIAERDLVFAADLDPALKQARSRNDLAYDRIQSQLAQLPVEAAAQRNGLLARLHGLTSEREQIAEQVRRASPRLAGLQYPRPLDLVQTRSELDAGTVLLSYSVEPERTVLFVVQPAGPNPGLSVFTIPAGELPLQAQVQEFRQWIEKGADSNRAALSQRARALYDLLVRPSEAQLSGADRLLIVPDGPLHVLPFAALLRDEKQYLMEWKPLHIAVSATVYAELKKMRRPANRAPIEWLGFGDPIYPSRGTDAAIHSALRSGVTFGRLSFSPDEINGIAALYPKRGQTFFRAEATEEQVKSLSSQARIIHFATHATLDNRLPLNSSLVLTIPPKWVEGQENGFLQAWEIFEQMHLDADLVVLSACETALGAEGGGEGLIGLTRAFQYAGARSILASLWSVDDRRTADLMKRFYTHLQNGKSKDEALRTAQLELIRRNASHPYYWAAFSLIGDWQ